MSSSFNPTTVVDLLSRDRLSRFKRKPGQWGSRTDAEALRAYASHMDDQSRYWVFIGGVEVILRNALDVQLCARFGDWTDSAHFRALLEEEDVARLESAWRQCEEENQQRTKNLRRSQPDAPATQIEHGHVVAALTFGFWRRLLIKAYDVNLWVPTLHKAFLPEAKSVKGALLDAASRVNVERNRLAHHETLKSPTRLRQDGLLLGGAISPDAKAWLDSLV